MNFKKDEIKKLIEKLNIKLDGEDKVRTERTRMVSISSRNLGKGRKTTSESCHAKMASSW